MKRADEPLTLGIETSCDETAAAVVAGGRRVLSNVVASQVDVHRDFGGVVPEIAARRHVEEIVPVLRRALAEAGAGLDDLDAVAVTCGPGLVSALLVGLSAAKGLALGRGLPLVGVNHLEGHVYSVWLEAPDVEPPFLVLIASGGHTDLVLVRDHGEYEVLGRTRDDAAGEAFDKCARVMGLGYPGGPAIDRAAREGDPAAVAFPRGMLDDPGYDFSFSGLKTAVVQFYDRARAAGRDPALADVAASFQQAVADVLVHKTLRAAREAGVRTVAVAGGVAANSALRAGLAAAVEAEGNGPDGLRLVIPHPGLCTDNAAMIAACGHFRRARGLGATWALEAQADLELGAEPPDGGRPGAGARGAAAHAPPGAAPQAPPGAG